MRRFVFVASLAMFALAVVAGLGQAYAVSGGLPFGALAFNRAANRHTAAGHPAEAAAEYRGIHRILQTANSARGFAEALVRIGDKEGALEVLRASSTRVSFPEVLAAYARALDDAGRHAESDQALVRAAALDPTDPLPYLWLGRRYLRSGQYDDAALSFERAIALDPSLTEARSRLRDARRRIAERRTDQDTGTRIP